MTYQQAKDNVVKELAKLTGDPTKSHDVVQSCEVHLRGFIDDDATVPGAFCAYCLLTYFPEAHYTDCFQLIDTIVEAKQAWVKESNEARDENALKRCLNSYGRGARDMIAREVKQRDLDYHWLNFRAS